MCSVDDIIYPVYEWDGNRVFRDIFCVYLRLNGVLDASKLRDGLWKLLHIGDWRKLGGRLRYKNGKLENHVPRQFTTERPAFNFAHESFDHPVANHPLAGAFPHAADGVCVRKPPADPQSLASGPGFPMTVEETVDHDVPHMSLKIMTFTDASLIICAFPHTIWDAFGFVAMMRMVQLVLEGREDHVVPILGARDDVLAELASRYKDDESPEIRLPEHRIPAVELVATLPQLPPLEERTICLPTRVLQQIRDRELLNGNTDLEVEDYQHFRDDELCIAWATQQLARSEQTPRPVALVNLLNMRFLVPSLGKAKGVFAQNMLLLAPNIVPYETAVGPIAPILTSQRDCIVDHAGPQQVAKFINSFLGAIEEKTIAALMGDGSTSTPILVNNQTKFTNNFDIDLSSALLHEGEEPIRMSAAGKVNFIHITNLTKTFIHPASVSLRCCAQDTYWLFGNLPLRTWELMQEDLEDL